MLCPNLSAISLAALSAVLEARCQQVWGAARIWDGVLPAGWHRGRKERRDTSNTGKLEELRRQGMWALIGYKHMHPTDKRACVGSEVRCLCAATVV